MKIFLTIFLLFLGVNAFAGQVNVVTGFGYLTDSNGHIVAKAEYPKGTANISSGFTYTEVANQSALDAITIYTTPLTPAQAFSTDLFDEALINSPLISDANVIPYFAALKEWMLPEFRNFQGLADMVAGLLQLGKLNQTEVDEIDSVMENQQINLDSYNAQVNVSY